MKRLLDDQKAFDEELNKKFDPIGKAVMKNILSQAGYTDIVIRKNEMNDGDKFFWDVKATNKNGKIMYFDPEVKTFWQNANKIPKKIMNEGFSICDRKSVSHNPRQGKTDYFVIVSDDQCGAFFVEKSVFESKEGIEKDTKYGRFKFRNIPVSEGTVLVKKDGKWQKQ